MLPILISLGIGVLTGIAGTIALAFLIDDTMKR